MPGDVVPLCLDLDGTVVRSDTLLETALASIKREPLIALRLPAWLLAGKAYFKLRMGEHTRLDAKSLPYRDTVVRWARQEAEKRRVLLVTATHRDMADRVAEHLGFVDEVIATDRENLKGRRKAAALVRRFGERGFDYAGNDRADLPVWSAARHAIVVGASPKLLQKARTVADVTEVFDAAPGAISAVRVWVRELRLHQWVKNLLVFLAPAAAHVLGDVHVLAASVVAFLAFSLAASGAYVLNDLLDLSNDRQHPRKRSRPLASGTLSLGSGLGAVPLLIIGALALAFWITPLFGAVVLVYVAATSAYSLYFKGKAFLDTVVLAALYMLRVFAGAVAVSITLSFWLLALCGYGFLGLALLKRYSELCALQPRGDATAAGRGYRTRDIPVVLALGVGSSLVATLVMALYIESPASRALYTRPGLLWLLVLLMTVEVGRLWIKAGRGQIDDDPVVFVAKDPWSLSVLVAAAVAAAAAI